MAFPYVNGASSAASLTQRGSTWFFRAGPPTSTSASRCPLFIKRKQDQTLYLDAQGRPQTTESAVSQFIPANHVRGYASADTQDASGRADRLGVPFA